MGKRVIGGLVMIVFLVVFSGCPPPFITTEQEHRAYDVFRILVLASFSPNGTTVVYNGDDSWTFDSFEYDTGAMANGTLAYVGDNVAMNITLSGDPLSVRTIVTDYDVVGLDVVGTVTINGVVKDAQLMDDYLNP